jgi:hypothetical protein
MPGMTHPTARRVPLATLFTHTRVLEYLAQRYYSYCQTIDHEGDDGGERAGNN